MKSDLFGALRAAVLVILIGLAVLCSITERNLKQEPHSPPMKSSEPLPKSISEPPKSKISSLGNFRITFYCCEKRPHVCGTGDGLTATGIPVKPGIVAVDPNVIPLGSKLIINGIEYIAADVGDAIKGNIIDIAVATHAEALQMGVKEAEVFIKE